METTRSLSATKPSAAILFVHGILGTPDHFSFLLPHVPERMTVNRLLLDGHGGTAGQFGSTSMATWRRQVDEAVSELRRNHRHVLIAAHSMGTLFAIDQAVRGRADRLFLLNPPLRLRITPRLLTTPLLVMSGHT